MDNDNSESATIVLVHGAGWRTIPSTYVVCGEDNCIKAGGAAAMGVATGDRPHRGALRPLPPGVTPRRDR